MTKPVPPKSDYTLCPDSELRFELESKDLKVSVQLKSGDAEIFGTELVKGNTYNFYTGAKVAIFTYYRCIVTIIGTTDVLYISKETPMIQYLNCHTALEQMRTKAVESDTRGPIAMVCGPTDVGKSTLCRIFLNYAVRMNRRPLFADLDVGQGSISIPGTISTILIERPANIEEGFSVAAPLIYHFGHKSPGENNVLYKHMVSKMAEATLNSLTVKKKSKHSGIIINTCGWVKGDGYKHLKNVAEVFQVGVIFVLDQERLYNELLRDLPSFVNVVLLPKSGGVVERNSQFRAESRDFRIKEYFYGHKSPLYPFSFEVKWSEIKVYKIGAPPLPDSCMPIGMKAENNKTKLVHVQPGPSLLHHILSITFIEDIKLDVLGSNIAGFVCVTGVDTERQVLTILSPQPRPLPNVILLLSDLQYMDNQ